LKAEGHDRINVSNNPVNWIDPSGLFWGEAWELTKSGADLGGSLLVQALIETVGGTMHIGEISDALYIRFKYEQNNKPSGKEIFDVSVSFSVTTAAEFGEQGLWGLELLSRSIEDGAAAASSCPYKNNKLSNFIQKHRSDMSDYSNFFKNDISDFIAGRNLSDSPFRAARYFYSDLGTRMKSHITDAAGNFSGDLVVFTKAIMQ